MTRLRSWWGRDAGASRGRPIVRAAAVGASVVVMLAGCAPLIATNPPIKDGGPARKPAVCTSSPCDTTVGSNAFGNRCSVTVAVDPIYAHAGEVVTWTIVQTTPDPIVFLPNGIVIDDPSGDFVNPQNLTTTFTWTANDRSSSKLPLKYSIHAFWRKPVPGGDGVVCTVLDPIIVNLLDN